jgi:hypothetical protein
MKGKIRILGPTVLGLLLVCALMLAVVPAAKVEASDSVSSVWMEFETAAHNNVATEGQYTIHFTTGTALSRGVDTITVLFPDGLDSTMGPVTTQDSYDFELGSADTTASYYSVDPTGDPLGTGLSYVTCTAAATIAGYRVQVTTPVDIPASTAATLKIATTANITTPALVASTYKIKVATSQDTTFVLSSAFPVDGTVLDGAPTTVTNYPSSLLAGAASAYKFNFDPATTVAIGGTVTVEFPVGTYLPDTIATTNVYIGDDSGSTGDDPYVSAVSVDTAARTVTATAAEATGTAATAYIYFMTGAGIKNPTTLGDKQIFMWTSTDGQKIASASDIYTIVAAEATKLAFCSDSVNLYSDDATIRYAFTGALIIRSVDQYGNLKHITGTEPTVALSVTTGAGAFYTAQNTSNPYTNTALSGGSLSSDAIYYRPTSTGTHTLQAATVGSPSLTSATWTVYVAPAVVLKDANGQTIGSYGPVSTSTTDATLGGAWIQAAIDASFPGDTVELGGSSGAPAIYEMDTVITLSEKITLTSATSASYTTLRPTAEMDKAINVTTSGTATNPVVIDGLTFTRLRYGKEFDAAVTNSGYDYLTVRNCTFNYIIPDASGTTEAVIWFLVGNATITSATISNNTFTNCVGFNAISGGRSGVIQFYDTGGSAAMSGVTVSGNTLTDCNDYGIAMGGATTHKATISNNTITNGYSAICLADGMTLVSVTGNTITNPYNYGIKIEGTSNTSVTIKNNTITGCAGTRAIHIPDETTANAIIIQYNDIYDNATGCYAIQAGHAAVSGGTSVGHDCEYNWYGDASGPAYTALTGAVVTTSNSDGTGDKISDYVTYYPWLYKSRAYVVADNANYCAQRISLGVGINTLSTPALLIPTADTIAELMPDYATNMEYCYKFDDGIWSNIGSDVLTPCHGYYIKMKVADSVVLQYDADEYYTPQWLLDEGWNLISLANLSSKAEEDAVASVEKDSAGLPGYSQVISPSMNTSSWSYSAGATSANSMLVGEAYWIYMQNDATLAGFTIFPLVPDLD